jgi:hypothetical protein
MAESIFKKLVMSIFVVLILPKSAVKTAKKIVA